MRLCLVVSVFLLSFHKLVRIEILWEQLEIHRSLDRLRIYESFEFLPCRALGGFSARTDCLWRQKRVFTFQTPGVVNTCRVGNGVSREADSRIVFSLDDSSMLLQDSSYRLKC